MLEKGLAVVPYKPTGAPPPSSLCEEAPAYVEFEENHAKVLYGASLNGFLVMIPEKDNVEVHIYHP